MKILKKKRKYKIHWFEYHDPMNWGETEVEGIKNIMQQFSPESKWSYDSDDGWIEVKAVSTFEAKDILEAKEIASGYECGGNDIFTVLDEYNNKLFDEGDI